MHLKVCGKEDVKGNIKNHIEAATPSFLVALLKEETAFKIEGIIF